MLPLRELTRSLVAVTALVVAGSCGEPAGVKRGAMPGEPYSSVIAPGLAQLLGTQAPGTQVFVVVQYNPAVTSGSALTTRMMGLGAAARELARLPFVGALATPPQISAVAALPGVVRITENRQLRYFGAAPTSVLAMLDRSVPTIKADQARATFGVSGRGIGVVILDSGIDGLYQPDVRYPARTVQNLKVLVNQADVMCVTGVPCAPSIYVENLPISETSVGHGTHVSGIAGGDGTASGGQYTGVAPGANLIGIGTGDVLFIFWALAGFDYVLTHQNAYNIKVVNNSWGTTGAFDPTDPINVATKLVHDQGITVVFAAGNSGPGQNTLNPYSVAPWVIGVAASCSLTDSIGRADFCGGGMLASFSSRGLPGDPQLHPTVTAPGVYVKSARASTGLVLTGLDLPDDLTKCGLRTELAPWYTCASGTSMATPHVTGVVALMQQRAGGALTPDRVKAILTATAAPMSYATFEVGAGLVDALAAVGQSQ